MEDRDEWLTPAEAGVLLKRNVRTLANWRSRQEGPPHYKRMARIEYRRTDIEEWLREQRVLVERDGEEKRGVEQEDPSRRRGAPLVPPILGGSRCPWTFSSGCG